LPPEFGKEMFVIEQDKNTGIDKLNAELYDTFFRLINYLRLSITDRCNLRCNYCMPSGGIDLLPHNFILSYEQALRIIKIFTELGVTKVRITGGEPFSRKSFTDFLHSAREIISHGTLHITTNGVLVSDYIPQLISSKIDSINISLDTLKSERFYHITGYDGLNRVLNSIDLLVRNNIPIKINTVVLKGINDDEICEIAEFARDNPIEVRFIEKMPFNGGIDDKEQYINYDNILNILLNRYPALEKIDNDKSTSVKFKVSGFRGTIGIIPGYSRLFCNSCGRIRVTSTGYLKTCLYDQGRLNLKSLIESGFDDEYIKTQIRSVILNRHRNGVIAETNRADRKFYSMSSIGG
jgi:cyclic pyranopterin phosphate synthase